MKILIDARLYGLENAGLGRYLVNLISSLQKIDNKNDYLIILRKKYFKKLNFNKNFRKILFDVGHYSIREQLLFPKIIKKENPDIVHYPHFNISVFCNKPFVVTIHDLLMHKQKGKEATTLPMPVYLFKRLFYKFIFKNAIKKSKHIIVPSNFVKREIVNFYKIDQEKITVAHEGVDFDYKNNLDLNNFLSQNNINKPYFLYVGNAYPHKNLKKTINAFAELQNTKKINFVIVSARNIFVKRLLTFVETNGYKKFIKIVGYVPDRILAELYKQSTGFIYPSISEGFGLQGLEAMILKTICLSSDIEAFREIYEDNAVYFDPFSKSSIKNAILKVVHLSDSEKENMIEKAYNFAKKYSWDKMAESTLEVYENCFSLRQSK